jgi:DMSO/TMAO reductase YedYZ molybdopterin-dependent catalytic subunit
MASQKLPPRQRAIKEVLIRRIGIVPKFDSEKWTLTIYGLVEKPSTLRWNQFLELPKLDEVADFHCVEGWSVLNNRWEGVSFKTIISLVKPKSEGRYVAFECDDGYTTSLPILDLLDDEVILTYKHNGEYLRPDQGGPLRLVVPKKYAYKSPMWLRKIKFTAQQELGYWEQRGYSNTADPWQEERYSK